jgi:NAD+ diphosphatase
VHVEKEIISAVDAQLVPLRNLLIESDIDRFRYPGLGNQLLNWYASHRFCGTCGTATIPHEKERAMVCANCKMSYYPRINPCVIVLITKGEQFLLASHARYRTKFFSCLAGFIEVGETPEQCVHREVKEEVGIEVDNVRYIQSQSWPFPSQLMLGYFADYKSGEVQPDHNEIDEAHWFTPDNIPSVPSAKISVAGELIRIHLQKYRELDG